MTMTIDKAAFDNRQLPAEVLENLYVTMCRIRAFEKRTTELFEEGVVKGTGVVVKGTVNGVGCIVTLGHSCKAIK